MSDYKNIIKNKNFSILPYPTSEKNQKFLGIALTLCAIGFFGFFAIKPTVSTIFKLQKELSDNQLVLNELETKIKNLTELRKQYFNLQGDLSTINNAITIQPDVHLLFAQIQSIAQSSNITIKKLQNFEVEIIRNNKSANKDYYSYSFTITGSGYLNDIPKFVKALTNMERIINIDTLSINNITDQNNGSSGFNIQGIAFFKDNL